MRTVAQQGLGFLGATFVSSVSLWLLFRSNEITTETQRTQRLHREEQPSAVLLPMIGGIHYDFAVAEATVIFQPGDNPFAILGMIEEPLVRKSQRVVAAMLGEQRRDSLEERLHE